VEPERLETVDDRGDLLIGLPAAYRPETNGWFISQINSSSLVQLDTSLVVVELPTLQDGDDQHPKALAQVKEVSYCQVLMLCDCPT
jgi:hypothetical protein